MKDRKVPVATARKSAVLASHRRYTNLLNVGSEVEADAVEFGRAMDQYKRDNNRPYPNFVEAFMVLKGLGYKKDGRFATGGRMMGILYFLYMFAADVRLRYLDARDWLASFEFWRDVGMPGKFLFVVTSWTTHLLLLPFRPLSKKMLVKASLEKLRRYNASHTPREQFQDMVRSGVIDANGNVILPGASKVTS